VGVSKLVDTYLCLLESVLLFKASMSANSIPNVNSNKAKADEISAYQ